MNKLNNNELCTSSRCDEAQTPAIPQIVPRILRLPKLKPGTIAKIVSSSNSNSNSNSNGNNSNNSNNSSTTSTACVPPALQSPSVPNTVATLGTDLGLPPLILDYPTKFLPEPVQNYTWRPSGTYQDPNTHRTWYLPNHQHFSDWVNQEFLKCFDEPQLLDKTPDKPHKPQDKLPDRILDGNRNDSKPLFPYQRFISEFFCPASPYRGILVNHNMGSGKSRTGIETAENFRLAGYKMVILLPASLRDNMIGEIRKWGRPDLSYPQGFSEMAPDIQARITNELNRRIRACYRFISYNSSRVVQDLQKLNLDNTCIMIDEIHDLINMMTSATGKVGRRIYDILMNGRNLRVIGLTGTVSPINYPHELGLLFNIIRGPIPIWSTGSETATNRGSEEERIIGWTTAFPENRDDFDNLFVDYETKTLRNVDILIRRSTGLVSYFHGARKGLYPEVIHMEIEKIVMDDMQFNGYWKARTEEIIRESRSGSGKRVAPNTFRPNSRQYCNYALPPGINRPMSLGKYKRLIFDNPTLSPFEKLWTEPQLTELRDLFIRILGFKNENGGENLTPSQSTALMRQDKRFRSKWASYTDSKARLAFLVDMLTQTDMIGKYKHIIKANEEVAILQPSENRNGVQIALAELSGLFKQYLDPAQDLGKCSRKLLRIIKNLMTGPGNDGPAFVFSNFRTLEGVEIFSRVLVQMGWIRYCESDIVEPKLRYAIVSGTESQELRTRIIEYYNHPRNKNGEYLKLILGTSSSAQGLSLMNCRQVHIMEPWWTLILILQVIGRARRIRSHHGLPKHLRKVYVFQYHSVLSEAQKKLIPAPAEHQTTDEYLYEKAVEKDAINQQCYNLVKSIAIDFTLSARENRPLEKGLAPTPISASLSASSSSSSSSSSSAGALSHGIQGYTYMPKIEQEGSQLEELKSNMNNNRGLLENPTYELVEKTYRYKPIKVGKERFAILLDKNGRPSRRSVMWDGPKEIKEPKDSRRVQGTTKGVRDLAIPLYDFRSVKFGGTLVLRAYVDSTGHRREPNEGQILD